MATLQTIGVKAYRTIKVSNVSEEVDDESFMNFLKKFGNVQEVSKEGKGQEAVYSVVYDREKDAKSAVLVNGTPLKGTPISVKLAQEPPTSAGGLPTSALPSVDDITLAAMRATQQGIPSGVATSAVPSLGLPQGLPSAVPSGFPPAVGAVPFVAPSAGGTGTPGAGITPQLLQMVRENPELASSLIPMLQAGGSSGVAEIQILQMVTEFHKQQALAKEKKKADEEKAALQRKIDALEAERRKKDRRRRRSSSGSSRGRRRRRSSSGGSRDRRRRRRRSRSSSEKKEKKEKKEKEKEKEEEEEKEKEKAKEKSKTPPPERKLMFEGGPQKKEEKKEGEEDEKGSTKGDEEKEKDVDKEEGDKEKGSDSDGDYPIDKGYTTSRETKHLYVVYPTGKKPPPLASVRDAFERYGTLTDMKVSRSANCIYASFSSRSDTVKAKDRLSSKADYRDAKFCYAISSYQHYLKGKDKKDDRRERSRDRDSREGSRGRRRR